VGQPTDHLAPRRPRPIGGGYFIRHHSRRVGLLRLAQAEVVNDRTLEPADELAPVVELDAPREAPGLAELSRIIAQLTVDAAELARLLGHA
jgi:hypothetical protein